MNEIKLRLLLAGLTLLSLPDLWASPAKDNPVEAQLVSEVRSIQAGTPFTIGLRFRMEPHWHTYWKNPGDAGLPTTLEWELPEGFKAGPIQWPLPMIFELSGLTNYGYENEVFHLVTITPPQDLREKEMVTLIAHTTWLMCEEVCIPGRADLSLVLPVGTNAPEWNEVWRPHFEGTRKRLPRSSDLWDVRAYLDGDEVTLKIDHTGESMASPEEVYFFSSDAQIDPNASQKLERAETGYLLTLKRSAFAELGESLPGVLFGREGWHTGGELSGIAITPPLLRRPLPVIGDVSAATVKSPPKPTSTRLALILLLALAGGAILNLMPCVFPVLGLKVMGFVSQAGESRTRVTLHGLVYTLGILVSFWILALILIVLRKGGEELGWGFQLQYPGFVFFLTILFFVFALNLSGLFEIGASLTSLGGDLMQGEGFGSSFFSGVLATVVATPCAAPFLAPALGAAFTLDVGPSLAVFTFIGLGLSLPYLTLSAFPDLVKVLPKPGPWMESMKQVLAFPLYATVGFLLWVLAGQLEDYGLLYAIFALIFIAMAGWIYGRWSNPTHPARKRHLAQTGALLLTFLGIYLGYPESGPASIEWEKWSPERVTQLRAEGIPVYVDFTARWCPTCHANKKLVFSSKDVLRAFSEKRVSTLKADWTNPDPRITQTLAAFGRSAIPFNIIYLPGRNDPVILPELLTPGIVLEAIDGI